jgi:hypothetical protein
MKTAVRYRLILPVQEKRLRMTERTDTITFDIFSYPSRGAFIIRIPLFFETAFTSLINVYLPQNY